VLLLQVQRKSPNLRGETSRLLAELGGILIFACLRAEAFLAAGLRVWCICHASLRTAWINDQI